MRLLTYCFVFFLSLGIALAQESKVPEAVVQAFKSSFAEATNVDWDKENDQYEVEFEMNSAEYEILYDINGGVVKLEGEITESELPEEVSSTLNSQFGDREIDEIEMIEENGRVVYEIELKGMVFDDKVRITSDGKVEES